MSKSLKNFITIRQALEGHTARQLRLMFLMQQWDKGMNYSDAAIDMAKAEEKKLKRFVGSLQFFLQRGEAGSAASGKRETDLLAELEKCKKETDAALKDNFNTSKAVDLISRLVGECEKSFEVYPEAPLEPVCQVHEFVVDFMGMLGVEGLKGSPVVLPAKEAEWTAILNAFASFREEIRQQLKGKDSVTDKGKIAEAASKHKEAIAKASAAGLDRAAALFQKFIDDLQSDSDKQKQLKRCDAVRDDDFVELGIRLEDGHKYTGFKWMFDDKNTLDREAREAKEKQDEAKRTKLKNSLTQKQQALRTVEKNAIDPANFFTEGPNAGLFAEFDENGIPTMTAGKEGKPNEEIGKGKQKDLAKALNKHKQDHEKLKKQTGSEGLEAYLAKLRKEVADLEQELN
jgi:cysteinyl-tRNA synthetase